MLALRALDPFSPRSLVITRVIPLQRERVFQSLLDNFERLIPEEMQRVERTSDGPIAVGSTFVARPNLPGNPEFPVQIDRLVFGQILRYRYLDGCPISGSNSLLFTDHPEGTEITALLSFQPVGLLELVAWYFLGGQQFHVRITDASFANLEVRAQEATDGQA